MERVASGASSIFSTSEPVSPAVKNALAWVNRARLATAKRAPAIPMVTAHWTMTRALLPAYLDTAWPVRLGSATNIAETRLGGSSRHDAGLLPAFGYPHSSPSMASRRSLRRGFSVFGVCLARHRPER